MASCAESAGQPISENWAMSPGTTNALDAQRAEIKARWVALLHIEPVNTPLANPDMLVFLIDDTLTAVFNALREPPRTRKRPKPPGCACGRNPFMAYYAAGRQSLLEALVLAQSKFPGLDPAVRDRDAHVLEHIIRTVIGSEIESFGTVCQHRSVSSLPPAPGQPADCGCRTPPLTEAW